MNINNIELYKVYYKLLFNIHKLSNKQLNYQLNKLHLLFLSSYLKKKFKDKRTIDELYSILKEELS